MGMRFRSRVAGTAILRPAQDDTGGVRLFAVVTMLLASCSALASAHAPTGESRFVQMTAALRAQTEPGTEEAIVDTESAGMTFAIARRGAALDVEFPFPGPAARHRYRFAVDRRPARAVAERIDAGGRVVAGPIRGRATLLFPLTATETFRFIETVAGATAADPYDARAYRVVDLGDERIAGSSVRHLHLIARGDAIAHPLTDVYLDVATARPRRIRAEIAPRTTPVLHVSLAFDYAPSGSRGIVTAARIEAHVRIGAGVTRSGHVDVRVERAVFNRPVPSRRSPLF